MTGGERGQTTAQVDTAETGQGGAGRRDTGCGTWRATSAARSASASGRGLEAWHGHRGAGAARGAIHAAARGNPEQDREPRQPGGDLLAVFGLFIPVLLAGALWNRSTSAVAALLPVPESRPEATACAAGIALSIGGRRWSRRAGAQSVIMGWRVRVSQADGYLDAFPGGPNTHGTLLKLIVSSSITSALVRQCANSATAP